MGGGDEPPRTSAWGGRGGPLMASQVFGSRDKQAGATGSTSSSAPAGGAASASSSSATATPTVATAGAAAQPDNGDASDRARTWDPATGKYVEEELPADIKQMMGGAWVIPKKDDEDDGAAAG